MPTSGPAAATEGSYACCTPYCFVFKQIGTDYYVVAVDAAGDIAALTPLDNRWVGQVVASADIRPLLPGDPWQTYAAVAVGDVGASYAGGCGGDLVATVEVSDTYETKTHVVFIIKTIVSCGSGGDVLHVQYTAIAVPK